MPNGDSTFHDPLAGRAGPQARRGHRRLLGVGRRARHERLDVHRAGDRVDRRRRGGGAVRSDRGDERAAARRRAGPGAADARRGGAHRRRPWPGQGDPGPPREADGLRPPGLPRRGPAGARAACHRPAAGRTALRGRGRRRAGRAGRAAGTPPGSGHRDQRRVLGRGDPGLRPGAGQHDAGHVHLRTHRRMVRSHSRAEAARQAGAPVGHLRRTESAQPGIGRRLGPGPHQAPDLPFRGRACCTRHAEDRCATAHPRDEFCRWAWSV